VHLYGTKIEQAGQSAGLRPRAHLGHRLAPQPYLHPNAHLAQSVVKLLGATLVLTQREGPRRQQSAAGSKVREVDNNTIAIATNCNVFAVHRELEVGQHFKRACHGTSGPSSLQGYELRRYP
jgi:hypothetical protein